MRRPAWHASALCGVLACVLGGPAVAGCPNFADSELAKLDARVDRNAHEALELIGAVVNDVAAAARPAPQRLAALYAIEAHAFSVLELDAEARGVATKGLELAPDPTDSIHVNLLIGYWENVYDQASLDHAAEVLSVARRAQVPGSAADLCLRITSGVVEMRRDHPAAAIAALTEAYRATGGVALEEAHTLAASGLASAMRHAGDYAQALELNREVTDYYKARGATLQLSIAHFLRGQTLAAIGDYANAAGESREAKLLSVTLGDRQGIAFANQARCRDEVELGHLAAARPLCQEAFDAFRAASSTDAVLQTQALFARIDLAEGHAERALATLKTVLANGGVELPARDLAKLYLLRARTNAALSLYSDAYADLNEYLRRYVAVNDAERSRQIATLRAQLETDRAIERGEELQRELSLARARTALQATQLRWTTIAIAAGAVVIALLSYILLSSLRHRRVLTRLATTDPLTGLPNRGHTVERANAAIEYARRTGRPVALALLDFDRFKEINDLCGHAAGDFALKEFAQRTASTLRGDDTLGRWGGEEFLLVLPNCALDDGYATVERLRSIAAGIELPNNPRRLRVSISAGITTAGPPESSFDEIVAVADAALYEAKATGRNIVRIAEASLLAASTGLRRAMKLAPTASMNSSA